MTKFKSFRVSAKGSEQPRRRRGCAVFWFGFQAAGHWVVGYKSHVFLVLKRGATLDGDQLAPPGIPKVLFRV